MAKKLYLYQNVGSINPPAYHDGGGLVIITSGDPLGAWNAHVDAIFDPDGFIERNDYASELPEPDRVIEVPEGTEDGVIVFPDEGCC